MWQLICDKQNGDTLLIFCLFYQLSCDFMFALLPAACQAPSEKGVYSIRKEFAPRGSKFFPYRLDPISEG